jgi:hypothetical protein
LAHLAPACLRARSQFEARARELGETSAVLRHQRDELQRQRANVAKAQEALRTQVRLTRRAQRERERENREREREQRERDRETEKRQTERQAERHAERQRERERDTESESMT